MGESRVVDGGVGASLIFPVILSRQEQQVLFKFVRSDSKQPIIHAYMHACIHTYIHTPLTFEHADWGATQLRRSFRLET